MIKIKVGDATIETPERTKAELQVRKTLDGNFLIRDHEDIDIIMIPEKGKILTLPKDMEDRVYQTQDRLMKFLVKKGAIAPESIRAGNVYGSIEAIIPKSEETNSFDTVLMLVSRWMDEERPYYKTREAREEEFTDDMLKPDEEESTDMGEIPHATQRKNQNKIARPYNAQKPSYWE